MYSTLHTCIYTYSACQHYQCIQFCNPFSCKMVPLNEMCNKQILVTFLCEVLLWKMREITCEQEKQSYQLSGSHLAKCTPDPPQSWSWCPKVAVPAFGGMGALLGDPPTRGPPLNHSPSFSLSISRQNTVKACSICTTMYKP